MAESFRWLFVDFIPLLCEKKRASRQFHVEMWLDPSPIIKSLKLNNMNLDEPDLCSTMKYVV